MASTVQRAPAELLITSIVPMITVADVERSADFYRLIGFEIGNSVPPSGPRHWAWFYAPGAPDWKRGPNLMVTRGAGGLDPAAAHRVLFYAYAPDMPALRERLRARGVPVGAIEYPDYLPKGEFCVRDPDGYTIMIAQSDDDTP